MTFPCQQEFNNLSKDWNNVEFTDAFTQALKKQYGEWAVFQWEPIGTCPLGNDGRRYRAFDKASGEIHWTGEVFANPGR